MRSIYFYSLVIFLLCTTYLCQTDLQAQDTDNQLWMNYAISVPINDKWSYGGDVGLRGLISNYDWNQILIRPNVSYKFNYAFSVSPAMAWFSTMNRDAGNVNEFRIHQDFNAKWPDLGFIEFFYRVRFEQRWFFYENNNYSNRFTFRLRGLIGIETADINLYNPDQPIYFQLIYEGFSTFNREDIEIFVNQTRFHVALGHRISKKFRYELHYIRQGSRLLSTDGIQISQNIYRVRFFHRLTRSE